MSTSLKKGTESIIEKADWRIIELDRILVSDDPDLPRAKRILKDWLFDKLGEPPNGRSIADALSELIHSAKADNAVAVILMRCIPVYGLLPIGRANLIESLIVEICESKAKHICDYLRLNPKDQTFQKFSTLSRAHITICEELSPLRDRYGDLKSLATARHNIFVKLKHKVVRSYCHPHLLSEFQQYAQTLFGMLDRVLAQEISLDEDYEECEHFITDFDTILQEKPSFLSAYFRSLVDTARQTLGEFIRVVRTKFRARIEPLWGPGIDLQKRYPLHDEGRELKILFPLRNEGGGRATYVRASVISITQSVVISDNEIRLGSVNPGDFSIIVDALILEQTNCVEGILEIHWKEIGNPETLSGEFQFKICAQDPNVDWESIENRNPYNTTPALGKQFIGRADLVKKLSSLIAKRPMEPFYITGQKRVGKTSLARAVVDAAIASDSNQMHQCYILWGDIRHQSPEICVKNLGKKIESFMISHLPANLGLAKGEYAGSLTDLISLSESIYRFEKEKRFVVIIDEFDEMPKELYYQGDLADTLFSNLRSLAGRPNIVIILVGGENMPFIMGRQGDRLNTYVKQSLNYFSREREWSDFQLLIAEPTKSILTWYDDAVSEIFNITNGNPFFAKKVCAGVLRIALDERDTDITAREVREAFDSELRTLGTNSFTHIWADGIPRPPDEREPYRLRRGRVLVAAARCLRHSVPITTANMYEHRSSLGMSEEEIRAVTHEFVQRRILSEEGDEYRFTLPILADWLRDVGLQELIEDSLSEELANAQLIRENAAIVKYDEIRVLCDSWASYRGQPIGVDDVQAWLRQRESPLDQRILFTLLKRTKFFTNPIIRERLEYAYTKLRRSLSPHKMSSLKARRNDFLVTYVDGIGKSGADFASTFLDVNRIAQTCIVEKGHVGATIQEKRDNKEKIEAIFIIDDIAGTGETLEGHVRTFLENHKNSIKDIKVRIITLIATEQAEHRIKEMLQEFVDLDTEFLTCEILAKKHYALPADKSGFSTEDDWENAKALLQELGSKIDKKAPFGYGDLGLLVVFPENTPNNTVPALRSYGKYGAEFKWKPLFERVSY